MASRDIKIAIKAQDLFSSEMERIVKSAEAVGAKFKDLFHGASTADIENLERYEAGLDRIDKIESGRYERSRGRRTDNQKDENFLSGDTNAEQDYIKRLMDSQNFHDSMSRMAASSAGEQARLQAGLTEYSIANDQRRMDFSIRAAEAAQGAAANALQNIFIATGSKNKDIFEVMKGFAIAQTVIDTYKGASAAYSALAGIPFIGPALGAAAAAAAIAAGMARVEEIRKTHPGGGSISASGHANPVYSGGSPSAYPVPQRIEDPRGEQIISIQIYNPLSEQNWQKIAEDNIIPAINNAADRNISLTVRNM